MSSDSGNSVNDSASANDKSNIVRDPMAGKKIISAIPKKREQLLKWNGWGYKDSRFLVKNRMLAFSGTRYPIGESVLPEFTNHILDKFKVDLDDRKDPKAMPTEFPEAQPCNEFRQILDQHKISYSDIGIDRLIRSHGQTLYDIQMLRELNYKRIPDLVVWPTSHNEVVEIVNAANDNNIVLIPYGGGTSVSGASTCPQNESRVIVVLDTTQMNRLIWLDRKNLTACFEAGIIGQDLERELQAIGLTVGHEPDSYEFSSLGGWVATRASGMKKNVYGNIEDIVVRVKMVTSKGVLEKNIAAPRISCGPDFNHIILGSEGTLGVVTEVVLKVRPIPPVKRYGSLAFPDFESGCECMREIAKRRCQPASIRLMDNEQFKFGRGLKAANTLWAQIIESLKTLVLTKIKGFNMDKISVATLLFEGEADDVDKQEKLIYNIAKKFGGIPGGATNGERGYVLTFVIAYIRDLALEYSIVAESFETSVPWDRCVSLCTNVRNRVKMECEKLGIKYYLLSYRVTQTYDAGCCIYFYFGYNYIGHLDPVETYEYIESMAREEILSSGGSLSHHHGIGKLRSRWYPSTVSSVGVGLYKATKTELDPKNIFAVNNLLPDPNAVHHEPKSKL